MARTVSVFNVVYIASDERRCPPRWGIYLALLALCSIFVGFNERTILRLTLATW